MAIEIMRMNLRSYLINNFQKLIFKILEMKILILIFIKFYMKLLKEYMVSLKMKHAIPRLWNI